MVGNYKIITLCGSTKFKDEFIKAQRELTMEGYIVLSVGLFGHADGEYEKGLTEARTNANGGNIEEASMVIQAVGEAYPELKANENYKQLMTELVLTENTIAEHRNNLNQRIGKTEVSRLSVNLFMMVLQQLYLSLMIWDLKILATQLMKLTNTL